MRLYLIIGALILLGLAAATGYFSYSQYEMKALVARTASIQAENVALHATNKSLVGEVDRYKVLLDEANKNIDRIRSENTVLLSKLVKHDILKDGSRKPSLTEQAINKAVNDFLAFLETISREDP